MTNDELRALANALEPMAGAPRFEDCDVPGFCAWVRACADAQPVAWMHDGFMSTDYERVQHDEMRNRSCGFKAKPIIPLYAHPAPNEPQAEPKREPLSDEQVTKGEYVLATKFGDGDPGDHWGVGFYDRFANGRHYVVDSAGKQIRGNGFRRVGRITVDVGRWFLSAGRSLEASPPGTVNLWTMLTERAHRIGGTDPALDDLQAKERA